MKKFIKVVYGGLLGFSLIWSSGAAAQTTPWVGRIGGNIGEQPTYNNVATDASGNVYIVGPYNYGSGTSNVWPTFSTHNTATFSTASAISSQSLPFNHSGNGFVFKSDASGVVQWGKQIAGTSGNNNTVRLNAIDADASGNVYITGSYRNGVDFDPATPVVNPTVGNSSGNNMFILKLNTAGEYQWHREYRDQPGGSGVASGFAIKADASGNIYVTCQFTGSIGFYLPSASTPVSNSALQSTGSGNNTAVLKLNASGDLVWKKHFSTSGNSGSTPISIDADAAGNVYTAGYFTGSTGNAIDFDPSHTTPSGPSSAISAGSNDIFLSRLDASGNYVWHKNIGGTQSDRCHGVAVNESDGSVSITGGFASTSSVNFNAPGTATASLSATGGDDVFVASYNLSDGACKWARKFGGANTDIGNGIVSTGNGDLYIVGEHASGATLDFDPGTPGDQEIVAFSTGNNKDAFLLKLTKSGGFAWVYSMGVPGTGNSIDIGYAIAAHEGGGLRSVYTSGYLGGNGAGSGSSAQAQFPVNLANQSTTPVIRIRGSGGVQTDAGQEIFLHKASEVVTFCTPTSASLTVSACDSFKVGDSVYRQSGNYTAVLTNAAGCDSTVSLTLTVSQSKTSYFYQYACDSIAFGGIMYYQTGNYTHTFMTSMGCDSTVTMFLALTNSTTTTVNEAACNGFTFNGQTYTQGGTYTHTLKTIYGCDSVVTLHLSLGAADTSVTRSGDVLTANAASASYQWINCNGSLAISGATGRSYTTGTPGSYAVIVTENGCTDTSSCYTIGSTGISSHNRADDDTRIYPNPARSVIYVDSKNAVQIVISSIEGRYIATYGVDKGQHIAIHDLPGGVYLVKAIDATGSLLKVIKLVKEE